MKKNYVKPEVSVYDIMPCAILAGSEKDNVPTNPNPNSDTPAGNTESLTEDTFTW